MKAKIAERSFAFHQERDIIFLLNGQNMTANKVIERDKKELDTSDEKDKEWNQISRRFKEANKT